MEIGERIKYCRQNQKMSREELAEKLNLSKHAIAKYEQGQRTPDGKMLIQISNALGLEISYLLESKFIKSLRLTSLLNTKKITLDNLADKLNLNIKILNDFMNNCEIKTVEQQKTLNSISDYLDINPDYILGETDFKSYEDDIFADLEILLDHVKVTDFDNTRLLFTDIIDSIGCTLHDAVTANRENQLIYIKNLYNCIYDVVQPLSSNAYSIFCPNEIFSHPPLSKEEIDKIVNKAKSDFCEQIDNLANYFQDIPTWNKDFHYEDKIIEDIMKDIELNQKD